MLVGAIGMGLNGISDTDGGDSWYDAFDEESVAASAVVDEVAMGGCWKLDENPDLELVIPPLAFEYAGDGGRTAPAAVEDAEAETSFETRPRRSLRCCCWLRTHSKVQCLFVRAQFVQGPMKSASSSWGRRPRGEKEWC